MKTFEVINTDGSQNPLTTTTPTKAFCQTAEYILMLNVHYTTQVLTVDDMTVQWHEITRVCPHNPNV